MKQTAVQWLFLMLNNPNRDQEFANKLLEKALEMEKEQICDAFYYGVDVDSFCVNNPYKEAEEYYKKTYETKND